MLGAEPVEPDAQTLRYFARGHLYSDYVCRQLEAKHGKENVQREVEIEWPLGTGHADAYIPSEKLLVEIKSTVSPSTATPMFDMSVAQLKLYLRFHPEAETGALYLINPSDLSGEDVFVVNLTEQDVTEIDAAVESVRLAVEGGPLPQRVCSRPGQARGRLCPFADPCFMDWTAPDPLEVPDPDAMDAAQRLVALKIAERPLKEQLAVIDAGKKEAQADLAELVGVGESVVGPWLVKRTHIERAPTFSLKAAQAAGFPVDALGEYMKPGAEYDTFTVKRAEEAGEIDFGEVPFE